MKSSWLLALALSAAGCASSGTQTAPAPAAAAVAPAPTGLAIYEGTYALEGPTRTINLRVWLGADGKLNGELVGRGQQTTFRPTAQPNKFLHATSDEVSFVFTVENGRATAATMTQRGREISGPRIE